MEEKVKSIIFVLTYDCNLRCSYCYEPKTEHIFLSEDRAIDIIKRAIDDVDESYTGLDIQFMGGEPLLRFDLIKGLCEWLWSSQLRIPILSVSAPTNGTLLTPEMEAWLTENKERFRLYLSFDGTRLMQNMNRSSSAPKINLEFFAKTYPNYAVKMTASPDTISHFAEGIKFLHEQGFNEVKANLAFGDEICWNKSHLAILIRELDTLIEFYCSHPNIQPITLLRTPVWNIIDKNVKPQKCYCGRDVVCYDYDGQLYPCHFFAPITIPKDMATQAQKLDMNQCRNTIHSTCSSCLINKTCITCYAVNFRDRGDCNTPSPFFCAQNKIFFFASCKLQKKLAIIKGERDKEKAIDKTIELLSKTVRK